MRTHATKRISPAAAVPFAAPPIVGRVLRSPGRPLGRVSGFDLAHVRLHTDSEAANSAKAVNATAYTAGSHIVFDTGRFSPDTASGRDLLHHELKHVMQQRSASTAAPPQVSPANSPLEYETHRTLGNWMVQRKPAEGPPPTSLDLYPEAEREALLSVPSPLPATAMSEINSLVAPPVSGVKVSYTLPASIHVVLGPALPASSQGALRSAAAFLKGQITPPLDINQTRVLDLPALGAVLRFSDIQHGTQEVMLIERLGAIPQSGSAAAVSAGKATFTAKHFKFAPSFSDSGEQEQLYAALATVPAPALRDGVTFARQARGAGNEAGEYSRTGDIVQIFDSAFRNASSRSGMSTSFTRVLAHELAHAVDATPLNAAEATYQGSTFTAADQRKLLGARALSGAREIVSGGQLVDTDAVKDTSGDFRVAATRDGVRPENSKQLRTTDAGTKATLKGAPIDYGNTDWGELFADSFSLYATDPHLLQAIRPHIYVYFAGKFPVSNPAVTP